MHVRADNPYPSDDLFARMARHNRLGHVLRQTAANVLCVAIVSLVCVALFS